jgi:hypothetical protein
MSTDRFFSNFPKIIYAGQSAIDLTRRVAFSNSIFNNPYIYYPYDVGDYERADQFSNRYYGDPYKSWIVYLSNIIIDPTRDWYYTIDELNELVTLKYGSLETAIKKIKYYRNAWAGIANIAVNEYDSLPSSLQTYWKPVYIGSTLMSYSRNAVDWIVNTNRIGLYSLANTAFIDDEVVTIFIDNNNIGSGQILSTSNNGVFIRHLSGVYKDSSLTPITSFSYVYGEESQTNSAFSYVNGSYVSTQIVVENLLPEEEVYWSGVSYFDYETEKNEFNKTIRVLDSAYASETVSNLKTLLAANN